MDGASLPLLMTPPGLAGAGLPPGATAVVDGPRAGFAAVLGATELAGLSAEQQAALCQLLADPAGTLVPVAEAAGKMSPPAAIVDLLNALGVDLKRVLAGGRAAVTTAGGDGPEASEDFDGPAAALRKVLEALLPEAGQAAEPAQEDGATAGAGGLVPPIAAPSQPLPPRPAVTDQVAAGPNGAPAADVKAPVEALWQLARVALPDGRNGQTTAPPAEHHPAPGAIGAPASPADAFVAALAVQDGDAGPSRPEMAGGANAGIGALLDAGGVLPGRAALAAAADGIPVRTAPPGGDGVALPVGERGWDRAFAERVVWMVSHQVQAAEVKLNPPHLGPVEVRLALNGQEASVSFTVAHGAVRDAVEQAIPRLREMFAEQNLQIVNVDVGQRDASSQASTGDRNGGAAASPPRAAVANVQVPDHAAPQRRESTLPGLVDEYA